MNLQFGKIDLAASIWLKLAGYTAAIIAGLLLYFYFMVAGSSRRLARLTREVELLNAKNANYNRFLDISRDMQQKKEKAEALLANYNNVLAGVDKTQNSFLDQINEVAFQEKVKLDKLAPIEANGKKYLDITFSSDYKSICRFFTQLEKYFRIEKFGIIGADLSNGPEKVEVRVSALAATISLSGAKNDAETRDIFDLYAEVEAFLKNIEAREAESASLQLVNMQDPMSLGDTIFPVEKKKEEKVKEKEKEKEAPVDKPPVTLDGIFWDPSTPVVVISGKALKEGEEFNGVKINKIGENNVTVIWKGRKFDLKK